MRWVVLFLVTTVGSGALGFGTASPIVASIGQVLFGLSLILLLVALIVCAIRRGGPARIPLHAMHLHDEEKRPA